MIKKEVWTCGVASKHICSNIIEPSLYDQNQKIKWQSEHVMLSLLNPHDVFPHEDNMISSYTCWLWDVFFWRWFTPFYVGMRKFHGYVHSTRSLHHGHTALHSHVASIQRCCWLFRYLLLLMTPVPLPFVHLFSNAFLVLPAQDGPVQRTKMQSTKRRMLNLSMSFAAVCVCVVFLICILL